MRLEAGLLVVIMAIAACLRFSQLDTIPPGMTHDEAAFGAEAEVILDGAWPVYLPLGYGHEPFYSYLLAVTFALFGHNLVVMRATAALFGLVLVPLTFLFGRRWFGFHVAWISALWMAVAFWPLSIARQALRGNALAPVWLLAAFFFWEALKVSGYKLPVAGDRSCVNPEPSTGRRAAVVGYLGLAGLFLGLSFYTYLPARVTWVVFPAFAVYLALFQETRALLRRIWPEMILMMAIAALIALPLGVYLVRSPGDQVRFDGMMGPLREFFAGKPERLLKHLWNGVRVFSWVGDTFWVYNIPERPIFDWAGSIVFYAGLLITLWHWRDPRYAFLLLWFPAGMFSGLVTTNEGVFWRTLSDQPVVYLFVALAFDQLRGKLQVAGSKFDARHKAAASKWLFAAWVALVIGVVADEGIRTYYTYFVDWPNRHETRNIHNQNMVAISKYLRDQPEGGAVAFSALYPLYYHDPWIFRYVAVRYDIADRWFDGRECVVYPNEENARFVFSALTQLDPALQGEFVPHATLIVRRDLRPTDENPYFEVWRWTGQEALEAYLVELQARSPMWISSETRFTQPGLRQPLAGGAQFGDVMALVGYRINGAIFKPGEVVELITYWRALRTVREQDDWDTFVHLLDQDSWQIGGTDVLDCPPTGWRPGDVAVQVHRFPVLEGAPRDQETFLEIGVYRHGTGRLPVVVDDKSSGDRVLLSTVTLR